MAPESERAQDRWSATHSITFGPAIWVNGKFFARVDCDIEMCRVSEENPVPEWRRLLSALIERMNQPTPPAPASCSEVVERLATCYHAETVAPDGVREFSSWFDFLQAEKILHEWRDAELLKVVGQDRFHLRKRIEELEARVREMVTSV